MFSIVLSIPTAPSLNRAQIKTFTRNVLWATILAKWLSFGASTAGETYEYRRQEIALEPLADTA